MAVSVGQTITASLWNANIGVALPHAEWTSTSASIATGVTGSTGTFVVDAPTTNTTGGSLATISSNTLTVADGIYDLSLTASFSSAPAAACYVNVADGVNTWRFGWTSGTVVNGAIFTGVRLTGGTVLTTTFVQNSGGARTLTGRWILTKVGPF